MLSTLLFDTKIEPLQSSDSGETRHTETRAFSVLLPERFSAFAPYTFGTRFNGILQSPLPFQSPIGF